MQLLLYLFRVCHLSILLTVLNGYVLFAANIDDLKTMVKKFVPDEIAGMVSPASMKSEGKYVENKPQYYDNAPKNKATPNKNENEGENVQEEYYKKSGRVLEPGIEYYNDDTVKNRSQENENKNFEYGQEMHDNQSKEDRASAKLLQEYEDEQVASEIRSRIKKISKTPATVTQQVHTVSQFNMDELVEKVKERLEKQFEEKYIEKINKHINAKEKIKHTTADYDKNIDKNTRQTYRENFDYDNKEMFTRHSYNQNDEYRPKDNPNREYYDDYNKYTTQFEKTSWQTTRQQYENQYRNPENENTNTPMVLFDEIEMTAKSGKDSYEDYVIPPKDDISDSNEKLYKQSTNRVKLYEKPGIKLERTTPRSVIESPSYRNDSVIKLSNNYEAQAEKLSEENTNYYDYGNTPGPYKAKTENLSYDYRISTDKDGKVSTNNALKVKKGTNIPTREHYKMSSPNYLAKIPIRAEKYDFNEPIPEKDREVEVMKDFSNPPANINGRVKLRNGRYD